MKTDECPAIRLINLGEDMTKFRPDGKELTVDSIKKFVDDVLSGKHKVCWSRDVDIKAMFQLARCNVFHFSSLFHISVLCPVFIPYVIKCV